MRKELEKNEKRKENGEKITRIVLE